MVETKHFVHFTLIICPLFYNTLLFSLFLYSGNPWNVIAAIFFPCSPPLMAISFSKYIFKMLVLV